MAETWLPFCIKRPGPSWKVGYGTTKRRRLDEIEGVVDHSAEGSMAGLRSVLVGPRQASWPFSLPKIGEPEQHYALEDICWHAGLPGDRKFDTSIIGNLTLVGKEHEGGGPGKMGEPWTESQTYWSARIDVAMRELCPRFAANPPILRLNQWEHRWLSSTSCPSDRNPWAKKFALIREMEDDDMAGDFTETQKKYLGSLGRAIARAIATGVFSSPLQGDPNYTEAEHDLMEILRAIGKIPAVGGGGLSEAQMEAIVERVLKRLKLIVE